MTLLRGAVSRRLIISMIILAVLASAMGLVAYSQVQTLQAVVMETLANADARYIRSRIRVEGLLLSDLTREYALQTDPVEKTRVQTLFDESARRLDELFGQAALKAQPNELDALEQVRTQVRDYVTRARRLMQTYDEEGVYGPLSQAAMTSLAAQRALMLDAVRSLEDAETTRLGQARRQAQATAQLALGIVLAAGSLILILAIIVGVWNVRSIVMPLAAMQRGVEIVAQGRLDHVLEVGRRDEFGALAQAFNKMTGELRQVYASLEERVASRTRELERRSNYLEASAQVSRAAVSILDVDELIHQVVELIRERFDLYYVGLFMVDAAGEWAILRAGTGTGSASQAAAKMLARGHKIQVGAGMIGWSVAHAQARIALEAGEDAVRLATAELPDTRSEAALPLRSRGQVIGALTVQSAQPGAFDDATIAVLQVMADQVAVALDNARLFAEGRAALETTRRIHGDLSRRAWSELLGARPGLGYRSDVYGVTPSQDPPSPEVEQAAREGRTVQVTGDRALLAVPIKVRDDVVGVLDTYKPASSGAWAPEEVSVLEELADRLGMALESARLFEDTQRRAARERLTGEVTARIRETLDMDTVLQTAVREMRTMMDLAQVEIRLGVGPDAGQAEVGP